MRGYFSGLALGLLSAGAVSLCSPMASPAFAQSGASLRVGSPAPALSVGTWAKGDPVNELERGKVYVVEFWATWCGPCKVSIPHLTKIQARHREQGLTIIGVSVDQNTGLVKPFVDKMGDEMDYTIGTDTKRSMGRDWMTAAGARGIPHAFVVDKTGTIAWAGNPLNTEAFEQAVEKALAQDVPGAGGKSKPTGTGKTTGAAQAKDNPEALKAIQDAGLAGKWDEALKLLDGAQKGGTLSRRTLRAERFEALAAKKDYAGAYRIARDWVREDLNADAPALQAFGARLLDDVLLETRDPQLAVLAATRAVAITREQQSDALALLARAHAAAGNLPAAIAAQQKAVARAGADAKAAEQETLETYREALKAKRAAEPPKK
jgi:thiol-disulfide isomerase/thioredoxin